MAHQAVSGIMVDGVVGGTAIENNEGKELPNHWWEMFQTADLIGVDEHESNRFRQPDEGGILGRTIFAMYGNDKIVTGFVPRDQYEFFFKENKDRIVLVEGKKPYILNGVLVS